MTKQARRRRDRRRPWQTLAADWLVIVGCGIGAAYMFAGAAGWL